MTQSGVGEDLRKAGNILNEVVDLQPKLGEDDSGVGDTELAILETTGEAYKQHLNQNDSSSYDDELGKLFSEIKEEIKRKNFNLTQDEEKDILLKLVEKIGILGNHFRINRGVDRLKNSGNPDFKKGDGVLNIGEGENCFFVPGCFLNLRKIIDLRIVQRQNVHINLGNGVNLQESIGFVKTSGELGNMTIVKFDKEEKLDEISITTGENCSFAHGCSFYNSKGNDIKIKSGSGVFFGINTLIGSGTTIGDFTTIWWNSNLGNNVALGESVIVGTSCIIEDNVEIPDDCLVPNFAKISPGVEIVPFEKYEQNQNHYVGNKNFVIKLSKEKNDREIQLQTINPNYRFVRRFNKYNVVPENKIFAAVGDIFTYLKEEIGFTPLEIFEYEANEDRFNELLERNDLLGEKEKIDGFKKRKRKSRVVLKAYPKNAERFLIKDMPAIYMMIQEGKEKGELSEDFKEMIRKRIEGLIDRPEFDEETLKNTFFGNTYITGKFSFSGECLFYNLKSRGDELQENETIKISDSIILGGIIHGGGNKRITKSKILDTTIHGGVKYVKSTIGEYGKPSVLNSTSVENSNISGHFTCNGAEITNTTIVGARVSVAGGNSEEKVIISNSKIGDGVSINTGAQVKNTTIPEGRIIGKDLIIDGDFTGAKK